MRVSHAFLWKGRKVFARNYFYICGKTKCYFDLTTREQRALWLLVNHCKKLLAERFHPDGFNVGINVGEAAGQSVFHVHIHLIPRYKGDVENPKGGVRGVIPNKQKY